MIKRGARRTSVLITDGEQRAALAIARSLGAAQCRVLVASADTSCLAGASRYVEEEHLLPDPYSCPEEYTRDLARLVRGVHADVLIPVTDVSMSSVLKHRNLFSNVIIPFPDLEAYRGISDKRRVLEKAGRLGIRVPRQTVVNSPEAVAGFSTSACPPFPVVVKPSRSVVTAGGELIKTSVQYADDRDELDARLGSLPESAFPVLLQERIEGPGMGVFLLLWRGELLAAFAHRRLREKPPSGGVSVLRESVPLAPELRERSKQLLEAFDWRGVAMAEYKLDAGSGEPVLMEVNGRFWGSLQLAIDSGVDFPRLLVQAALEKHPEPTFEYRTGVRCRWLWGDVDHLITRLRHSRRALKLPPEAPSRGASVLEFLRSFAPGTRAEVFRWTDPRPALHEGWKWLLRR